MNFLINKGLWNKLGKILRDSAPVNKLLCTCNNINPNHSKPSMVLWFVKICKNILLTIWSALHRALTLSKGQNPKGLSIDWQEDERKSNRM